VHQYFILDRPDLAMFQRGQARTIEALVTGFDDWLSDRLDAPKAPRRLLDLVRIATEGYERVARDHPDWLAGRTTPADLARMGRGRGIADFVSSLTDQQAVAFAERLSGARELLWTTGAL
jgi:dGTPase